MTLLDSSSLASVAADGHVEARFGDRATHLHPQWLREQSTEPGQIEATNRQRLFTPLDIEPGLVAIEAELDGDALIVAFSDGHRCRLPVAALIQRLGWGADPEAPPTPIAWAPGAAPFPTVSWPAIAGSLDEPGVAQATVEVALSLTKFCSSERPQQEPPLQSPPVVEKSSFDQYVFAGASAQKSAGGSFAHG